MNDQSVIPLFVAGSLLLTLFGFFLIAYLLVQKKIQVGHQLEKKQMAFDYESNLLRVKIDEQEHTMDQISKELHDNVKSLLGFAQFNMHAISDMATRNEQTVLIEKTTGIIADVINALHNISHSLNSNFVKNIGLADTIIKELEYMKMAKNISYDLEIKGEPVSLGAEKELHIFRILQEALQNCAKHAQATTLDVALDYRSPAFTMTVTDNGLGFDKNKIFEMKGLGFLNMFQRARYVHGGLEVQSAPAKGTTIVLTLNRNEYGTSKDSDS